MKYIPALVLVGSLNASAAITLMNVNDGSNVVIVLNDDSATNTATIIQTFTIGDAQAPGTPYSLNFLQFNIESEAGETLIEQGGSQISTFTATLSGAGINPDITEPFQVQPGFETVTFGGPAVTQLQAGEEYTLTLSLTRAADDAFTDILADYTEIAGSSATPDAGETISGPWATGPTSNTSGGSRDQAAGIALEIIVNVSSVPEPSSALLAGLGMIGLLRRRR